MPSGAIPQFSFSGPSPSPSPRLAPSTPLCDLLDQHHLPDLLPADGTITWDQHFDQRKTSAGSSQQGDAAAVPGAFVPQARRDSQAQRDLLPCSPRTSRITPVCDDLAKLSL